MKIVFNNDENEARVIVAQSDSTEVCIEITQLVPLENVFNSLSYSMNAEELRDFIGGLLHIQSKINKGGKNV